MADQSGLIVPGKFCCIPPVYSFISAEFVLCEPMSLGMGQ